MMCPAFLPHPLARPKIQIIHRPVMVPSTAATARPLLSSPMGMRPRRACLTIPEDEEEGAVAAEVEDEPWIIAFLGAFLAFRAVRGVRGAE